MKIEKLIEDLTLDQLVGGAEALGKDLGGSFPNLCLAAKDFHDRIVASGITETTVKFEAFIGVRVKADYPNTPSETKP